MKRKLVFIEMKITLELNEEKTNVADAVGQIQYAVLSNVNNCFVSNLYVDTGYLDDKNSKSEIEEL